jgi:hypothetical protein
MTEWRLHWLEAEGDLRPWHSQIRSEVEATRALVSNSVTPPRLDILVQRLSGAVIPEIGMVGHAYRRSLFALTLDPENANFAASLLNGTLRRQVAHEVHHCLRIGGPGYGRSLGEALVSEGLAGHFVKHLFNTPPEAWERVVDAETIWKYFPDEAALTSTNYDHAAWFFGADGQRPRWIGYTLGYAIASRWLETTPEANGALLVGISASEVLSAWRRDAS